MLNRSWTIWATARIVTAHDLVYGFRRALDPATGTFSAFMLAPLVAGGEAFNAGESDGSDLGVRAIDDFTFEGHGADFRRLCPSSL